MKIVQAVGGIALGFYFTSVATCFLAFYWKGRCKKTLLYVSATCGFAAGMYICEHLICLLNISYIQNIFILTYLT